MPSTKNLLARVTAICSSWAEASTKLFGSHTQFLVRKKTFAYFLDNHHGDGIVGVTMKGAPGQNTSLIARDPKVFYMPAYVGVRGWIGMRLDTPTVSWPEVEALLRASYLASAPKKLASLMNGVDAPSPPKRKSKATKAKQQRSTKSR